MWTSTRTTITNNKEAKRSLLYFLIDQIVGSVVKWLKRRAHDQHGLSSKPTRAILLRLRKRHFAALFPAWWSWQAVQTTVY